MFAVIKTGGKQYRVAAGDKLKIEKIEGEPGKIVQIGDVLLVGGDSVTLGVPTISGASVAAEVLEQSRGPKVIAFKKRRRKNSRRKRGYRHDFTVIRITEILTDGQKPSKIAKPRPEPKAKAAPAEAADAGTKPAPKAKEKAPAKKAAAKKPAAKVPAKKPGKPAAKSGKGKKK
jgi:large subunit ribosomal protein L21